jgi:hypothetical protein
MDISRTEAVSVLRRAGYSDAAEEVSRTMPDPVDPVVLLRLLEPFGIGSINDLIMRMGGSP